jgi:ATP synthase I chain
MDDSARRVWRLIATVGVVGTVAAFFVAGARDAVGFAVGSVASALNYRWLKRTVDLLGSGEKPKKASVGVLALRYLILGTAVYVTLTYFGLNVLAVLTGLLVSVAAVILEILYELIYAGT